MKRKYMILIRVKEGEHFPGQCRETPILVLNPYDPSNIFFADAMQFHQVGLPGPEERGACRDNNPVALFHQSFCEKQPFDFPNHLIRAGRR